MRRMVMGLFLLSIIAVAIGVSCGPETILGPIEDDDCDFSDVQATPDNGAGPLHRRTPIVISFRGDATPSISVRAYAAGAVKPVLGEVTRDEGRATFTPADLYPADAIVDWRVLACGKIAATGAFSTGVLTKPQANLERLVEVPFALDLRSARMVSPVGRDGLSGAYLKLLLSPQLRFFFVALDDQEGTARIAPARYGPDGDVVPVPRGEPVELTFSTRDNPYLQLPAFDLDIREVGKYRDGVLRVRDAELVLGLVNSDVYDGTFSAELELSQLVSHGEPVCDIVERLAYTGCHPCGAMHRVPGQQWPQIEMGQCLTVVLQDVTSERVVEPLDAAPAMNEPLLDPRELLPPLPFPIPPLPLPWLPRPE